MTQKSITTLSAPRRESENIAKATAVIASGNITSRILGLIRESILAGMFGAGTAMDAFRIAIIVPRGIYDLLIGGHVNSALIPVLSEYAEKDNEDELWGLVSALICLVTIGMSLLILSLEVLAPVIIRVVASSEASDETLHEATRLLRITAPALFFMSLFAVMSSLLYALRRFTLPAFGATAFNLTIVAITVALATEMGITAAAVGWLCGAVVQLILQWYGLWGVKMRFRLIFTHPGIRRIVLLYAPVMFSLALDVLINRPFSYNLASRTGSGSISTMEYATTLVQFPHGLVATAISVAVLPTLSRQANLLPEFKRTLGEGLRLALALIIPATIGLIVLATPTVALIFEHGEFNATNTATTALALRFYMIGLPFASIDLLLIFAFYARQDTLTPAAVGLLSLVAYMATAHFLLPYYGLFALMIADSIKHFIHASVSGWLLMRRVGGLSDQKLIKTALRASLAALIMGLLATGMLALFETKVGSGTVIKELIQVSGIGGVCGIFYLLLADRLGISEIQKFFQHIKQRL